MRRVDINIPKIFSLEEVMQNELFFSVLSSVHFNNDLKKIKTMYFSPFLLINIFLIKRIQKTQHRLDGQIFYLLIEKS